MRRLHARAGVASRSSATQMLRQSRVNRRSSTTWRWSAVALGAGGLILAVALLRATAEGPATRPSVSGDRPPSSAPRRPTGPPAFDDRAALRTRVAELEEVVAQLRADASALPGAAASGKEDCNTTISQRCPVLSPPREVLLERARCGTVVADIPPFIEGLDSGDDKAPAELTADERAGQRVRDELTAQLWAEMDGLYRELAGSRYRRIPDITRLAERLKGLAVHGDEPVMRQIAEERAGLRAPPTPAELASLPPADRFWRLWVTMGDRYEELLGKAIGAPRARAMRESSDGWSFRYQRTGTCPE